MNANIGAGYGGELSIRLQVNSGEPTMLTAEHGETPSEAAARLCQFHGCQCESGTDGEALCECDSEFYTTCARDVEAAFATAWNAYEVAPPTGNAAFDNRPLLYMR